MINKGIQSRPILREILVEIIHSPLEDKITNKGENMHLRCIGLGMIP